MKKELAKHQSAKPRLMASSGFPANKYTAARHSGPTLREMTVKEIETILEVCAMLAGFGRDFEETELKVLVSSLIQNKGYFKGAEIKTAFDCAFSGELNISPQDLKPYNQFSWLYLARILNAYEKKVQEGKLIQDISEPIKDEGATPEQLIQAAQYVVDQIKEQFTRKEDHDFGPIGNIDTTIVNMIYDKLKLFGYQLGTPQDLRTLYVEQRANELKRAEYWRKQKERGSFAEYKDKNFMTRHKEAMKKNKVHREVAKRCRMISVAKFYDECREFDLDLCEDVQARFETWAQTVVKS